MRYRAKVVPDGRGSVSITCTPSWLGRLFGRKERVVYAFPGEGTFGKLGWFLPSGYCVNDGMQRAIDELPIAVDGSRLVR